MSLRKFYSLLLRRLRSVLLNIIYSVIVLGRVIGRSAVVTHRATDRGYRGACLDSISWGSGEVDGRWEIIIEKSIDYNRIDLLVASRIVLSAV